MEILKIVLASPAAYLDDSVLSLIAKQLVQEESDKLKATVKPTFY